MKKLKKRLSVLLCVALIMAMAIPVSAAMRRVEPCPRCHTNNVSFEYESNSAWRSDSARAGEYCEGCGVIVPAGESHSFYWTVDRYTFLCNGKRCSKLNIDSRTYTEEYDNAPSEHYTTKNGVRRRDY